METSILVVEDDDVLREVMADGLRAAGHAVRVAADAGSALAAIAEGGLDLALLDIGLGAGPDGVEICRRLRREDHDLFVMMLTARGSEAEVVLALEAGADDYVTKPVGLAELRSRVAAALRRTVRPAAPADGDVLRHGPIALAPGPRTATVDGTDLRLTPSEYAVLQTLLRAGGAVRSRGDLLVAIFGDEDHRDPRAVDVHVHHLREKLERSGGDPTAIATVRGAGYRLGG
jgi:DNA-binding response OmpR family regulator